MVDGNQVERKIDAANRSQLARELGVRREHVSQVLSGRSVPSLAVAAGIAKGIGVSLDELWGYLQTASVN
jgi:transcriptional regulator with XRE-family HTH domain